jgi:Na+/H+-dicarboxylate symporter
MNNNNNNNASSSTATTSSSMNMANNNNYKNEYILFLIPIILLTKLTVNFFLYSIFISNVDNCNNTVFGTQLQTFSIMTFAYLLTSKCIKHVMQQNLFSLLILKLSHNPKCMNVFKLTSNNNEPYVGKFVVIR